MLKTVETTIDRDGTVRLSEPVTLDGPARALVTIVEPMFGEDADDHMVTALLSEKALAEGWSGPAEDTAWAHLDRWPALDEEKHCGPAMWW
jgi:hypothetical protein